MPATTVRGPFPKKALFLQGEWNRFLNQYNGPRTKPGIFDGATAGKVALGNPLYRATTKGGIRNGSTAGKLALGSPSTLAYMENYPETLLASTLAAATQNGKIKIVTNSVYYQVAGVQCIKAPTDNLWDLSALGILGAAEYMATVLYLDSGGTASIASGAKAASAAAAIAALPFLSATKAVIGVFVGNPNCNYANAIPAAQGTLYQGFAPGMAPTDLQTAVSYELAGVTYKKVMTDDLWDLSAETDTIAAKYRAYWLCLDSGGTASIVKQTGADSASAAAAIAALPKVTVTKAVLGVYVAGPSTDFNGAAGLAAQGTIYDGLPAGGEVLGTARVISYSINGTLYQKAPTEDLWDLSAETDTAALKYRAYYLYLDSAGTATIAAQTGADSDSEAEALTALPDPTDSKAVMGVYVAGPSTDFNGAAGLDSYGTYYNAMPGGLCPARVGTLQ